MKNIFKKAALFLLVFVMLLGCFASCEETTETPAGENPAPIENVDYVAQLKLDMTSNRKRQEVTTKLYIDGDTTHFYVPTSVSADGILKARYLAINTPESTGKIEPWGKKASDFTKEKLSNAASIIVESDTANWDVDSTGNRYLVWVWYKPTADADYRNLNLEILQNGLCIASSSANNVYGEICMKALNQAKAQKLYVHSGEKDPNFHYGAAIELTLKELRCNIDTYLGAKVAFEGVITRDDGSGVYIEEFDADTDMYYGIYVYYATAGLPGAGLKILTPGNRVRIVGSATEFQGTYQISGLQYRVMAPNDPANIKKISDGHEPSYVETAANTLVNGNVEVTFEDETKTFKYGDLATATTVSMTNLTVKSVYTTVSNTDSNGAMTITCTASDGTTIKIRTDVIYDADGNKITEDIFTKELVISVRGIVDYYKSENATVGTYQVFVLSFNDITI